MNSKVRHPFVNGVAMAIPIFVGYTALGIPYGMLGVASGIPAWVLVLMSTFILAGSAQFVAVQMIAAGAGVVPIIIAGFALNVRHIFMAMSLGNSMGKASAPLLAYIAHSTTDEAFGVNISKADGGSLVDPMDALGTNIITHASWVVATLVGAYLGGYIPAGTEVASAALPIMFAVLLALQIKGLVHVLCAVLAVAVTVLAMSYLPKNWSFLAAALVVPTIATIYEEVRRK
jgi:4-azaleucine resistance transporter AzlC